MGVGHPVSEELDDPGSHIHMGRQIQISMGGCVFVGPHHRERGEKDNDAYLEGEHCVEHNVHLLHQVADLTRGLLHILHYLSLPTHIDYHPIAIVCVSQCTSS